MGCCEDEGGDRLWCWRREAGKWCCWRAEEAAERYGELLASATGELNDGGNRG